MTNPNTDSSRRDFIATAGATLLAAGIGKAIGAAGSSDPLDPPGNQQPPSVKIPAAEKKTGWALVGLGQLCIEQVLPAIIRCEKCKPVALVSGHPEKAKKIADHYGIDQKAIYNYDNFDTIRDNPNVDVVYIILPNAMHAEFTIRALKAGKHVLCEKPMAMTVPECKQMIDAAKSADKKLMIGYRLRHEPFNQKAIEVSRSGELGKSLAIECVDMQNTQAPNTRLVANLGGGPIYDVGVYCINAARYITGEEPIEAFGWATQPDEPRFREVPGHVTFQLRFPSGAHAYCSCGFDGGNSSGYRAMFQKGYIETMPGFPYQNLKLKIGKSDGATEPEIQPVNHFTKEFDHFADCVQNNKEPLTPGEEGLADLKVIEAVNASITAGKPVKI